MLPGISFAWTGGMPPRPPPGAWNERYSRSGNLRDSKRHANTFSRKFRVATGSVLESSEKAIVPSVLSARAVFRFAILVVSAVCGIDIHWIVYRPARGSGDSGAESARGEGRSADCSSPGVSGGSDPGKREASGSKMDIAHPSRHGLSEAESVRTDPSEQSRPHAAGALPSARRDGGGGARGTPGKRGRRHVPPDGSRRRRRVHPPRLSPLRHSPSRRRRAVAIRQRKNVLWSRTTWIAAMGLWRRYGRVVRWACVSSRSFWCRPVSSRVRRRIPVGIVSC